MNDHRPWEEVEGMLPGPTGTQTGVVLSDAHPEDQLPTQDDVDAGYEAAVEECAADRRKQLPQLAALVYQDLPATLAAIQATARALAEHDGGDWHDRHDDWTADGDLVLEALDKAQEHLRVATALMRPYLPQALAWPAMTTYGYGYAVHIWQYEDLHTEYGPYNSPQAAVDVIASLDRLDPEDGWEIGVVYRHTAQTRWGRYPAAWLPEPTAPKQDDKQHG